MMSLTQDVRFASRTILKTPLQSLLAVLVLGIGIGLVTIMFNVVHGVFLRALPFENGWELFQIAERNLAEGIQSKPLGAWEFAHLKDQQTSFEQVAGWYGTSITISDGEAQPERYNGANVTPEIFRLLRVEPVLGRSLHVHETTLKEAPVVMVSHEIWQNRYHGEESVIGRHVRINGNLLEIIGVMPEGFAFPLSQDFWLPLLEEPRLSSSGGWPLIQVVARARDGVSQAETQAELAVLSRRLAAAEPQRKAGTEFYARPYIAAYSDLDMRSYLSVMLLATGAILLIACGNAANLILARVLARTPEIAMRTALGASRFRILRQFMTEALVLASLAGLVGLGIASLGTILVSDILTPILASFWIDIKTDGTSFLFALGLAAATTVLMGWLPAWRASSLRSLDVTKSLAGGASEQKIAKWSRWLVVGEIAFSSSLLMVTALMIQSLVNLSDIDYRFRTDNVLTAQLDLPPKAYTDQESKAAFYKAALEKIRTVGGVHSAAFCSALPVTGQSPEVPVLAEGSRAASESELPKSYYFVVTEDFFEVFGSAILEGRSFTATDDLESPRVAIVTQGFARHHWIDGQALGRRIAIGRGVEERAWLLVVGVVADDLSTKVVENVRGSLTLISEFGGSETRGAVYLPMGQRPINWLSVAIHTAGAPTSYTPLVREAVSSIDKELPVFWVGSMKENLEGLTWDYRLFGLMFSVFGLAAFLIAIMGLYSMMALSTRRRTFEFGLRIAMGAQKRHVQKLVLESAGLYLGSGLTIGFLLAVSFSRTLSQVFFQVEALRLGAFFIVVVVFLAVGLLACVPMAAKAARSDPMRAIKCD